MKQIIAVLLTTLAFNVHAEAIAKMPNQGGGFIVLTNDPCVVNNKNYEALNRFYSYTAKGFNVEGCFRVEDDTIITVWQPDGDTRRYPITSFTLINRGTRL